MALPKDGGLRRDYVHPPPSLIAVLGRFIEQYRSLPAAAKALTASGYQINPVTLGSIMSRCQTQRNTVARLEVALGLQPSEQVTVIRLIPAVIGEQDAGDASK